MTAVYRRFTDEELCALDHFVRTEPMRVTLERLIGEVRLARFERDTALARATRAEGELAACREVLRKLEWSSSSAYVPGWPGCPVCKGPRLPTVVEIENGVMEDIGKWVLGHKPTCTLAAALRPRGT